MIAIYGLVDRSHPWRIRYVGQSQDVARRVRAHRGAANRQPGSGWRKNYRHTAVAVWVRSISDRLTHVVLEECATWEADEREAGWITDLRHRGQADLNVRRRAGAIGIRIHTAVMGQYWTWKRSREPGWDNASKRWVYPVVGDFDWRGVRDQERARLTSSLTADPSGGAE